MLKLIDMQLKLVVFALMLAYSCDNVLSHFTTSGNQLPLLACMRNMENIVQNVLCSQVGQYFTESFGGAPPLPTSIASWQTRDRIIRSCCLRPCSVTELMSIC